MLLLVAILMTTMMIATPALASTKKVSKSKTTITLSHKGTVKINRGAKLQLSATTNPVNKKITWKSSKPKIASISKAGLLTAKKAGTTTITAKSGKAKAKVKVKVVDPNKVTKVTITNGKSATLTKGETLKLNATLTPSTTTSAVTWKSSNKKVATVDANGNVTAVGEGSATIKATAGKKSAKVRIKVVDPNKPTKVAIAQGKSVSMTAGQTVQLSASVTPSTYTGGVTWTSSKPKIATVDANGVVTGLKKGKVKITAKAGKKKASITVNVTGGAEPAKVTGIALSRTGTVSLPANETLALTATLQPAGATGTVTWSSSNKKVATVSNGVVTPHKQGTVTITAKCGKKKAKVKVKVVGAEAHVHNWTPVTTTVTHPEEGHNETITVTDSPAWDETVVDSPESTQQIVHPEEGHYEDKVIVDKDAWDEKVWVENKIWIVDKPAWVEKTKEVEVGVCGCHLTFNSKAEYDAHVDYNRVVQRYYNGYFDQYPDMKAQIEAEYGNPPQYKVGAGGISQCGKYSTQTRDVDLPESEWIYHDEEGHYEDMGWYDVVHHDAETHTEKVWVVDKAQWTETVQVPAVTHVVHHDAVTHTETKWVVDKQAWNETVTTGYHCYGCGADKGA